MCFPKITVQAAPSELLMMLGVDPQAPPRMDMPSPDDTPAWVQLLARVDVTAHSAITKEDVETIYKLFRRAARKKDGDGNRLYPGLDLLLENPPTDPKTLGAGDSPEKQDALQAVQQLFSDRGKTHTRDLFEGNINIDQWRARMRAEVKTLHVGSGVAGGGGNWDEMLPEDWGSIGGRVGREYGFLDDFARELDAGNRSLNQALASVDRYAETASSTYEAIKVSFVGIKPEVLRYFPGDGTTVCRSTCKCRWNIRIISKRRGDFNASWLLGSTEDHCPTCVERRRTWRGVKIRGGQLVEPLKAITR